MENLKIIARIKSDFPTKFGIPRQSNLVKELKSAIIFEPEYRNEDALRGLEDFSHLWLIWGFSKTEREGWSPTVRPPRLGGSARMGVFATRSPYRPNGIGLSSARIERIDFHSEHGPMIHVLGADLMDATPIYDIKPYVPFTDCHADACGGFADTPPAATLQVVIPDLWSKHLPHETAAALKSVLAQDPRPPYHNDPDRVYGMLFAGFEIKFAVAGTILTVLEIAETGIR
jgi:tRNA-Thr(GGU) m(6)t(6)A37 methyltransferase TsaA